MTTTTVTNDLPLDRVRSRTRRTCGTASAARPS